MKVCNHCGAQLPDDSLFCVNCGSRLEQPASDSDLDFMSDFMSESAHTPDKVSMPQTDTEATQPVSEPEFKDKKESSPESQQAGRIDIKAAKGTLSGLAEKTLQTAKVVAVQINDTVEKQKEKSNEEAQKQIDKAQVTQKKRSTVLPDSQSYMSDHELWSWLKKDNKRQHFFTEEPNMMASEEYMNLLQQKIDENQVPAVLEYRDVQWDRMDINRRYCTVSPQCEAINPLTCLVQFNHVGCFTFVEEKTFITPPDLPEVPMKPVKIPADLDKKVNSILWGFALMVIALFFFSQGGSSLGVILIVVAAILFWIGFGASQQRERLRQHNRKCAEQEEAWNTAWDNWQQNIFMHSFQEDINGEISRIFDSVFDCIQQHNNELFKGQASTQQDAQSMNELEQLISRRKDEYR